MTAQSKRDIIANEIYQEINKSPDSISNLICCVVDECSMCQLERILIYYRNSLPQIYRVTNNQNN